MQAIILAAGMGKRLKKLTKNNTKCMVMVNDETIIERMLYQLDSFNLKKVIIVVGYEGHKLIDYISKLDVKTPVEYIENDIYYKTNNIYSLYMAKDCLIKDDTLLLESDLIFKNGVIKKLLDDSYPDLALVAKYESWMDGTVVTIDEDKRIESFIGKKDFEFGCSKDYFKTVNIYKFSREFSNEQYVPFLEAYCRALGNNEYYEQVLKVIAYLDKPGIKGCILESEDWYEIDDVQDLDIAETIFEQDMYKKYEKIKRRYGGYWRYPGLLDFCYLVNPYYPPQKLIYEIQGNLTNLLGQYPSGMEVNSLLAGKFFGVSQALICVGNGAAELISALMSKISGHVGIIYPSFDEYANRIDGDRIVAYIPGDESHRYSSKEIIDFFNDTCIENLIIVNPDNPSGNYIEKSGLLDLLEWSTMNGIKLIVDESFVDFAECEGKGTLIDEKTLREYSNLIVVKSISKSYGVPGLRLGILASGDEAFIERIKNDVAIWNINSFAEFFMQIQGKYQKEYAESLINMKNARKELIEGLSQFEFLSVFPSQANFVMCEVKALYTAKELSALLLCRDNIFIKDLSDKKGLNGEYVRISVRNENDNILLILALEKYKQEMRGLRERL